MRRKNQWAYTQRHYRKEKNFKVQEAYEELQSIDAVSQLLGIPKSTVHRWLLKAGLTQASGKKRFTCCEPECERRTDGKMRCAFHWKVNRSKSNRAWWARNRSKKILLDSQPLTK